MIQITRKRKNMSRELARLSVSALAEASVSATLPDSALATPAPPRSSKTFLVKLLSLRRKQRKKTKMKIQILKTLKMRKTISMKNLISQEAPARDVQANKEKGRFPAIK